MKFSRCPKVIMQEKYIIPLSYIPKAFTDGWIAIKTDQYII